MPSIAEGVSLEGRQVLSFPDISLGLHGQMPFDFRNLDQHKEEITGLSVDLAAVDTKVPDAWIEYQDGPEIGAAYDEEHGVFSLYGPSEKFSTGAAVANIAQYLAECLRPTKRTLMLIHSAAVTDPDDQAAHVILGEKGAGKTTLALRLCHQYGFGLVGNDQVYLGINEELIVEGGNQFFNIRQTALAADRHLRDFIPPPPNHEKAPWNNKVQYTPSSLGIHSVLNETPVAEMFHVRIDHTQDRLHSGRWDGVQQSLVLHERIGRHISGQATPLLDDEGVYYGTLPRVNVEQASEARDRLVKAVMDFEVTEVFSPNSELAIEFILERVT